MHDEQKLSLETLYRAYAEQLFYYLVKLSGSKEMAEDLVQETFIRATVSLEFSKTDNAKAWLFRVARNVYLDEWRKRKRRERIPFLSRLMKEKEMISPYGIPEEEVVRQAGIHEVKELLMHLPEKYRTILYLREYEEFTYKELQSSLELSEAQVKTELFRARKKLKEIYEKAERSEGQ
ncbi:sigma-70 family RNA polymerase sigma factor [Rossellomorea vietnamensis]|uniref:Sigma-70 family RNA polymerase sigma factor n=1 Tax=Rossellomorea vietnamensis TaxID=218284 RepID=A0A5D4LZ76_9BACI|nr:MULTISPECIES: sigma-70 family RNA polymerase sigma factor [Bacillaceae]TYR94150.1 sigma-70 family RNA polymerase sigma factor [Rossellomorea vietnamensis]